MTHPRNTLGYRGQPLAYFDLEFTGLDPYVHDITEIAVLLPDWAPQAQSAGDGWVRGHVVGWGAWVIKVWPENLDQATSQALFMNGFDEDTWKREAVSLSVAMEKLSELLTGVNIVGHNLSLDMEFVRHACHRCELPPIDMKYKIDSSTLIWQHLTPLGLTRGNLHDACTVLGISNHGEHTALVDVLRCKAVVDALAFAGSSFSYAGISHLEIKRRIARLEASREACK